MGEFDAAGEIVSGALLGRAVERRHGETRGDGHGEHGGLCLNCGTSLVGPHCHRCGQVGHVHRTIGAIGHELLHGVVHFEGKLWRTLPMLVLRPGELTRRYIHGERAHFVSPMAMFLFSVFTMFAVLQIMGVSPPAEVGTTEQFRSGLSFALEQTKDALTDAQSDRAKAEPGSERAAKLDKRIAGLNDELKKLEAVPVSLNNTRLIGDKFTTGWHRLDKGIEKANKNPGLALYKLQANSYKFSWALIPLSIPFVWLLFAWRRRYHGYDHAVFVTYSLAFMSLLFIVLTIAGAVGVSMGWLATVGLIVPPIHIFFQMKGAYRLRGWNAALRTFVLLHLITLVVLLFGLLLLGLGLVG
ncbi:DUF3667 domain-containing protein [Sphingomonas turrisvirgatae]|uniref:DUF3667 domain-containing protein n=1 Tax=Sphingomonas turrisvirgatae TaxID=1888892 RepID=A0A1E3LWK2_9SPHN|nr:DUF3667 domain-containing protein [Sphingomonas turrisvirgatae]ODP38171.1 hypothetical protein BFL28_15150 [Sphingomonas turrisvirgatae]